ncbi:TonB-dependent receptor domain-containing protein [Undibacterium sp. SXout20W]|uniref:TonB-dependent receptor domain-containing protein n=1 Tax=Undibacterium sp. SXout20W TaxID=3413051 RepID=UPI003BF3A4D0
MVKEKILSQSVRIMFSGGMIAGLSLFGAVASAQEAAPAIQKVEVTGTRIPTINVDGPSPVTQMTAKDIKIDGARAVEDLLNNLPQVFADQGGAISNGASGTATVSLRGLGSDRTLVLVNGRRMPYGSTSSSAADLNEIPAGLIKRVDVLTGGAGAVYGAGAVAGVVNFILKDNFEGVEMSVNSSGYNHKQHNDSVTSASVAHGYPVPGNINYDGQIKDASVLVGGNFADNKGNATLYFSYKKTEAILQSARDFSSCTVAAVSDTAFACSGSSTSATGRITGKTGSFTLGADGNPRKYVSAQDAYNFGPINYLQRPSEVYGFNAQGHFDINENVRIYNEFNFHNYHTAAQVAAGGIFYGPQTLTSDNPFLTPAWQTALGFTGPGQSKTFNVGKRNVEGGPRIDDITDQSFRDVLGVKGTLGNWTYDVFGQVARVNHSETKLNYFSAAKIGNALDAITDPKTGKAVCRSTDPTCVPYNMFAVGGITQAALNYLQVSGLSQGHTDQTIVGGNIGSDLAVYGIKTPWSTQGVGVSFGVERRTERLVYAPDYETSSGDLAGAGAASPAINGSYSVQEVFGEVHVPIAENLKFIKSLDLSASYRYSDYSTNATTNTYGLGVEWSPVKELRLRGSYQQAVRAPTIFDLYNPSVVGLGGPSNDPCGGTKPTATAAQCANTGVTAAQYGNVELNSANQYQSLTGGNANVKPEKAKTYTMGFVVEPVKNLSFTVDWFSIKIEDTISSVDPTTSLSQCLTTGNPIYCNLIHRDSQGSLWLTTKGYIAANTTNIGKLETSGVDVSGSYFYKLNGWGSLAFNLNGTYLSKLSVENTPGLGSYDCVGYYGPSCGTPTPKWRSKARVTWDTPWKLEVAGTWRHMDSVTSELNSTNPLLNSNGPAAVIESQMGSRDYFDLYAAYPLTKNVTISGGINNLFDRDPPVVSTGVTTAAGSANGNTYPQVYDSYGRKIFVNLTAKF